jgi:hypothetical protein
MGLRIFDRLFRRREERYDDSYHGREDQYYDGPPEVENDSLLVDHHFIYPPEDDYEKHVASMIYQIEIENNTDYPMGNLRVEFNRKYKLGRFGEPQIKTKLLDPGDKTLIKVPFEPLYQGGSEEFEFEIVFFDFNYKVEESILMKTEPLKVVVPKFRKLEMDEDGYRFLTADLYRWVVESDTIKIPPQELFSLLTKRLDKIGFSTSNEMENPTLYRGIRQMVATDQKGRKWAVQVQVIGQGKESRCLIYTFGERPLSAYNLAVKLLLKIDSREQIIEAVK